MTDHPNAELLKGGYAAFGAGDMDSLRNSYFDPGIQWHQPGNNHFSGTRRGIDEVLNQFMQTFQETDGTFSTEIHDVLANDDHAVALASFTATKDGKTITDRYTHVCHIKDGKLTESWIFGENQPKVDEFWG